MGHSTRFALGFALVFSALPLTACSSTSDAGGAGSGGTGGGGQGGSGGAAGGGPCQLGVDCLESEYCHFADHGCGLAEATGTCLARPIECSHKPTEVCSCDGSVTLEDCPQLSGNDVAVGGNCTTPIGKFPCGYAFCKEGVEYCQTYTTTVGSSPEAAYGCALLPQSCGTDDSCACVSTVPYPCGAGTCVDDAAGHAVVTCTD